MTPLTTSMPFDSDTTRYRPINAFWLAHLSKLAYPRLDDGPPDLNTIEKKLSELDPKFSEVKGFDTKSSQAVVIKHENYVVASFRGTDEIGDWLDNLNVVAEPGPLGNVHRGFNGALMDIWPAMKSTIRHFKRTPDGSPDRPLWLTGHSLGGALATLAAASLVESDEPFYGLYTYGCPRVGDRTFARFFNVEAKQRTFRFQNNSDIITRVPSRVMGYSHIGSFVYINVDGELSTDIGRWYRFLDTVKGVASDIGDRGWDAIKDHHIDEYIEAIGNFGDRDPG